MRGRGRSREEECRARLTKAAGRELSEDEFTEAMERLQQATKERVAGGETFEQAARNAGNDEASAARTEAVVARRNRARAILAMDAALKRIPQADEHIALPAMIEGRIRQGRAYGLSAAAVGRYKADAYKGALMLDLRKAGLDDKFRQNDPVFAREVFYEKWNIDHPEALASRPAADPQARQMAQILAKHDEIRRLAKNEAGAWVGKADNWGMRQTHDMMKIRNAAGGEWSWNPRTGFRRKGGTPADFAAWRDVFAPNAAERTFKDVGPEAREAWVKELWNRLASGVHEQTNGADWLGGFKGPGNLAKRLSQERKIFFKDADAAYAYNQKFGRGSLLETMDRTIEHDAHNIAQMEMFSNNPEAFIQNLAEKLRDRASKRNDLTVSDGLAPAKIERMIDVMTGKSAIPANASLAYWLGSIRNLNVVRALGKAMLSSFSDIGANAAMLRRNGIPYFESIPRELMSLIPGLTPEQRIQFGMELGAWSEGTLTAAHRWRAEDSRYGAAWTQRAADWMFTLNGQNYWNRHLKTGNQAQLEARYAYNQRFSLDQLDPQARATLDYYGIGEPEWQAMRQVVTRTEDGGHSLLFPAEILNLPDEAVAHLGPNPDQSRRMLADKYGALLTDQVGEGMSEPTMRERRQMLMGFDPALNPVMHSLLQFQSFGITFVMRSLGREVTRAPGGGVDVPGIAKMMAAVTIFGMFTVIAKDLVGGKDPRDRLKPEGLHEFILESLAQGGGFGFLGDILFGKNLQMRSLAEGFGGPTVSALSDVQKMFFDLRDGELGKFPARAARFFQQNAPYANLYYFDLILKHFFFYGLQEYANPGYLRRMEQKARQNHQTYWLRPTEAVQF